MGGTVVVSDDEAISCSLSVRALVSNFEIVADLRRRERDLPAARRYAWQSELAAAQLRSLS